MGMSVTVVIELEEGGTPKNQRGRHREACVVDEVAGEERGGLRSLGIGKW